MKPPKAKLALFFNSEGVAAGRATITARQSLSTWGEKNFGITGGNGWGRDELETVTGKKRKVTHRTFSTT